MEMPSLFVEKISIVIPIIRPQNLPRLFRSLKRYGDIEICCEIDEKRIGCPKMVKELVEKSTKEIVVFLADDVVVQEDCLENAYEMMASFDGGWGLVGLNDMQTKNPTHWMAHKKLLPLLDGEFFHTGYIHCFCDNELQYRCEKAGRYKWCEKAKIKHLHPFFETVKLDDDYKRVYSEDVWKHDEELFKKRNLA
jgi:hypothetical protein